MGDQFEPKFEEAVLGLLVSDRRFWGAFGKHIDQAYVGSQSGREILAAANAIAAEAGWPGGTEVVIQRLRRKMEDGGLSRPTYTSCCRTLNSASFLPADAKSVRAELKDILKAKKRVEVAVEVVDAVGAKKALGDFAARLEEVERIGDSDETPGVGLDETLFGMMAQSNVKHRVPTGYPELDITLGGGLPRGCLGLILGSSGSGKSIMLSQIAAAAISQGYQVLYVTLEVDVATIGARILSPVLGVTIDGCLRHASKLSAYIRKHGIRFSKIVIKDMPGLLTTVNTVLDWIKRECFAKDFRPDVFCLDYLSRLGGVNEVYRAAAKGAAKHDMLGDVTQALRNFAEAEDIALWTANQATRQTKKVKRVEDHDLNDQSGSMQIGHICDVMITLNVSEEEDKQTRRKSVNVGAYVAKNRHGKGKVHLQPVPANYSYGTVFPSPLFPRPNEFTEVELESGAAYDPGILEGHS